MPHGFDGSLSPRNQVPARVGERAGRQDLTIESGELCRSLSKLPVFDLWMIFCCNAMRAEMAMADRLVFDDSITSLLTIHHALPRHQRPQLKSNWSLWALSTHSYYEHRDGKDSRQTLRLRET
jgi:hypothetical protein